MNAQPNFDLHGQLDSSRANSSPAFKYLSTVKAGLDLVKSAKTHILHVGILGRMFKKYTAVLVQ
eukprot:2778666-Ditylum_brightwellii.AAC.1